MFAIRQGQLLEILAQAYCLPVNKSMISNVINERMNMQPGESKEIHLLPLNLYPFASSP